MRKLYIIGNGFDIAHGLDTSYSSFRKYLVANNKEKILSLFPDEDNWRDFENNLCLIDKKFFILLRKSYGEISLDIIKEIFDDVSKELAEFLMTKDITTIKYKLDSRDYYFSFNYTNVLYSTYGISFDHICQIHGAIWEYVTDTGKLILGHGNNAPKNEALESMNFIDDYFSYINYTRKNSSEILLSEKYVNFISRIPLKEIDEIICFGYSYSEVDHIYIEELYKLFNKNVKFMLCCYNESDVIRATFMVEKLNIKNYHIVGGLEEYNV